MAVSNRFIYKRYFPVNLNQTLQQKMFFNQQEMRKMVLQGIEEE
jgi:hypothetical protein